jgi:hypothetical protein
MTHRLLNEEVDRHMKEFSQPFCLGLADGPSTTQHFSGGALVAQNRPMAALWFSVVILSPLVENLTYRTLVEVAQEGPPCNAVVYLAMSAIIS